MKKEEKEIAVNKSSGAEKVEKIEKKTSAKGKTTRKTVAKTAKAPAPETAKGEAALGSAKKAEVKAALMPYLIGLLLLIAGVPIAIRVIEIYTQLL